MDPAVEACITSFVNDPPEQQYMIFVQFMNFYALLCAIESLGQLTRRPLPPVTLQLVGFTGAINFLQYIVNESFLPIYRYGVLPAYVVRRYFLTPNIFCQIFSMPT